MPGARRRVRIGKIGGIEHRFQIFALDQFQNQVDPAIFLEEVVYLGDRRVLQCRFWALLAIHGWGLETGGWGLDKSKAATRQTLLLNG